jgi:hypothetical protein
MWVPKPTGFLSEDACDILTKDTEFGPSDYSRVVLEATKGVLDEVREYHVL